MLVDIYMLMMIVMRSQMEMRMTLSGTGGKVILVKMLQTLGWTVF